MMLQQNPCCMAKPNKSFFNVLRRSKKSFEKAAMSILRIVDLFMKDFFFSIAWKLILILIIHKKFEGVTLDIS